MSAHRVLEMVLWPVAIVGVGALTVAMTKPPVVTPVPPSVASAARTTSVAAVWSPDSLGAVVVGRDLFRADRGPPPRRFQDATDLTYTADAEPRPVLALVGLVAGAEPTALVEGLPGSDGARVVRAGERIGALHVRRIRRGTVEISGMDTLWVLHVREPWNDRP